MFTYLGCKLVARLYSYMDPAGLEFTKDSLAPTPKPSRPETPYLEDQTDLVTGLIRGDN